MRLTRTLQHRLEQLLAHAGYTVRYEKGRFRNGSCVIEERKLIVLNKFYPSESRINSLLELALSLPLELPRLEAEDQKLLSELRQRKAEPTRSSLFAPAAPSGEATR